MRKRVTLGFMRRRGLRILAVFTAIAIALIVRLVYVQVVCHDRFLAMAMGQTTETVKLFSPRGTIYDRNGKALAFSVVAKSLYADPGMLNVAPADAAAVLAPILHMSEKDLTERLSEETRFVWLSRTMEADDAEAARTAIAEKKLKGFGFIEESKRCYPNHELLANVLGFVGIDGDGLDGLEKSLETEIRGRVDLMRLLSDARGNPILKSTAAPISGKMGRSVYLTIDSTLQYFAETALDHAMAKTGAAGAMVIMMDAKTGDILALANRPTYDPNRFYSASENEFKNRAVVDVYEPGSTFKPITAATALAAGTYTTEQVWHDPGEVWASGHAIKNWDNESYGDVRMIDILKYSVNTGFAHVGLLTGGDILTEYAKKFGFGSETGIELPGEAAGILFNPKEMRPIDVATMSIGQAIAVTPLQMVQAYSALANGGQMMKPHIIAKIVNEDGSIYKETKSEVSGNPVPKNVADTLRDMMEKEVSEGGGGNARVLGYHMGGKTGTAQKIDTEKGGYLEGQYVASFCGFGPTEDPRVICLVVIDNPNGLYYGGVIAAPVFSEIMGKTMRYLGVAAGSEELEAGDVLQALQDKKESETEIQNAPAADGESYALIPDFTGFSIRDVSEWLAKAGLGFRPEGSGTAVRQDPPAGTSVKTGSDVTVWFEGE